MADARTLLRQQRAAREQARKPPKQAPAPAPAPVSRKRKAAEDGSEDGPEDKKRSRTEQAAGVPAGFFDARAEPDEVTEALEQTPPAPAAQLQESSQSAPPPLDPSAEAELDAFLTEMNKEPTPPPRHTFASGAVIEAAPMTAAELAAQAREEQMAQRARTEEDMEADKEEAARALEDEFEEMEGLDERVKKLRDQREALRSQSAQLPAPAETSPVQMQADDDDDDDDDEDWDDWRFRPA